MSPFDEAHSVYDREGKHQFPLGALLSALVAVQDDDDHPSPVMHVDTGHNFPERPRAGPLRSALQLSSLGMSC